MVNAAPLSLRIADVSHAYRIDGTERTVLDGIDLRIAPGAFVALLGASGSGKSTLLRLIAGLERPRSGRILADDVEIAGPGPDRLVMFQDPTLYPWRSVRGNIALGHDIAGRGDRDAVERAIDLVGLRGFERAWPHQLSGGMAQRVALARALVNAPRALLLDEPLGKLDSLTRLTMQTELRRLWEQRGFTAVMVTHDVEEALLLATRVVVIGGRPGRVIGDIAIDMQAPRHRDDARLLGLRRDILGQLGHRELW
jgi:NitT/TauT family transport system ATP-binding protein